MNSKKLLIKVVGLSALLLGICMNTYNATNDYGIKNASLSEFVLAQGTTSSVIFRCDQKPPIPGKVSKDSMDYPKRALLMDECDLGGGSWNGSVGVSVSGGKNRNNKGSRCACKYPGKDFNKNNLGCNAEWETNCVSGNFGGSSSSGGGSSSGNKNP